MSYPSDASAVREACYNIDKCLGRIESALDVAIITQPTWLDQAAMMAMQGMLAGTGEWPRKPQISNITERAYDLAHALWAEKQRREAGGGK